MIERLVVVGGSIAGLRAVEAARDVGFTGSITLLSAEPELPYDRPPLSKAFLDEKIDPAASVPYLCDESRLRHRLGVRLELGVAATALDVEAKIIEADGREFPYDALIIATGARPRVLPGTESLVGVHSLRTLADARAIRDAFDRGARTVVIGAGFIGSELASAAAGRGLDVTIIDASSAPLARAVGPVLGPAVARLHAQHGTPMITDTAVSRVENDGTAARVVLQDGRHVDADLVVVGIGVEPSIGWLRGSGLELANGVSCGADLWTGIDGVYAAGDVADWMNPALGIRQRTENRTAAAEQGAAAARNAVNPKRAVPYATVPYFWSDWYDSRIQFVGRSDADDVEVVDGVAGETDRWVALYRGADRVVGALAVNGQTDIMKYRGMIGREVAWSDAIRFATDRRSRRAEPARMDASPAGAPR